MEKLRAKDYRQMAAENVSKCTGKAVGASLVAGLLMYEAGIVVGGPTALGYADVQKAIYEKKDWAFSTLFKKFDRFGVAFVVNLLEMVFLFLWCLLLYIPGIIKSFSYSMTFYLMNDNENLTGTDAITESRKLMNGHKWELFCLMFSYIGWVLLSCLTLGILMIWVAPKMDQAKYCFYRHITGQDAVEVAAE